MKHDGKPFLICIVTEQDSLFIFLSWQNDRAVRQRLIARHSPGEQKLLAVTITNRRGDRVAQFDCYYCH